MRQVLTFSVLLSFCLLFVSCGGAGSKRGPLVSTPPAKKIVLKNEAVWGNGFITKKYTFPTGTYFPSEESGKAFYYSAPESLKVFDTGLRYGASGGIHWEKGKPSPEKVYVKAPFGSTLVVKPNAPLNISQ